MTTPLRIAVANWTDRIAGGAERYLHGLIPRLREMGHEIAIVAETSEPHSRTQIDAAAQGVASRDRVLQFLADWRPDLIFQNGMSDEALENATLTVAPGVLVAHSYYGTCVSGTKTWQSVPEPCSRPLGPGCLLHYYPHRCGGLNPATMIRQYALQSRRNGLARRYSRVVALSAHMREELSRNGIDASLVPLLNHRARPEPRARRQGQPWRLLFAGRLQFLKGGHLLIKALRDVPSRVGTDIELTFLGDGPDRNDWEAHAARVQDAIAGVRIAFAGWLEGDALQEHWRRADLAVVPSIWPEPLGLVGADAAEHGLPTVAFASGGIPEWLEDGVNGVLAPAPPTVEGLADALASAMQSDEAYGRLAAGVARRAVGIDFVHHAGALSELFRDAAHRRRTD